MNMKLVQLLDSQREFLALYTYNGDAMTLEEAVTAIDEAHKNASQVLVDAGEDPDGIVFTDVDADAEEALAEKGIYRTYTEEHYLTNF